MDKKLITYHILENESFVDTYTIDAKIDEKNIHFCFFLERNAYLSFELIIALSEAIVTMECVLKGEGAHASIKSAYLLRESNNVVLNTIQHHQAARTVSNLVVKGVLYDNSSSSYKGMIYVDKEARHSVSSQEHKSMLLSNNARTFSVPSLEVKTNDVQCFHGSAIGRFDANQLFYAASRGLSIKKAQGLLVNAFFANVIKDEGMKSYLSALME